MFKWDLTWNDKLDLYWIVVVPLCAGLGMLIGYLATP